MYAYGPLSVKSLFMLLSHHSTGPEARWRRYTADLLRVIASGMRIDPERSHSYEDILKEVYSDPFVKRKPQPQTTNEIIAYIGQKVEALLNGSA